MLDHFADNYVAYSHFKAILERQMKKSERRRWAGEVAVYDRKWQIQVYFSIREKELVFKFTEGVVENKKLFPGGQELGGGPGSAPRRYKLPATEALFSQLQRRRTVVVHGMDEDTRHFCGEFEFYLHEDSPTSLTIIS